MIPTPQFVVFYNGIENRPEYEEQRLSDAYNHEGNPSLELICKVYNINEVLKIMTIDMTFERREQLIRKEEQKEGLIL